MASKKLNYDLKYKMVGKVVAHATQVLAEELEEAHKNRVDDATDIMKRILLETYGEETIRLVNSLHSDWTYSATGMSVRSARGYNIYLNFKFSTPLPVSPGKNGGGIIQLQPGELSDQLDAYVVAKEKYSNVCDDIETKTWAVLNGISTVAKLKVVAPEIYEICKDILVEFEGQETKALAPVVNTLMCDIAKLRHEEREGCECAAEVVQEVPQIAAE